MEEVLCLQQKMELPGGARKSAPIAGIARDRRHRA
jgi:hypothetical protein